MIFFSDSFLAICPLHDLVQAAPRKDPTCTPYLRAGE